MGKHFLKYPRKNISTARMLRKNMTAAERMLWSHLRNNQLGVKFRRQVPMGPYILDFLSIEIKLEVELDGRQHYTLEGLRNDHKRDEYLKDMGMTVLRYSTINFLENVDGVVDEIRDHVQQALLSQSTKA